MITVEDALTRIFALVPTMPPETVRLEDAAGRVLAADAVAGRDQPPFPASAMDGYAVRASDAAAGTMLDVVGEAAAGGRFPGHVGAGQAVRIFTGAPVPDGADAILIQEDAHRTGTRITVSEAPAPGRYIRPAGGDFRAGASLTAPRRLSSRDIALLAAMNVPTVKVARRPVIALIPTGNELVVPGEAPGPDQILTSNNYGLAAMLARIGAAPRLCPIARDTQASLRDAFHDARGADLIVTLGGASVGDHDLVAEVGAQMGLTLDFYKVAMRPGKPLMAGQLGGAVMLGLPGNPVSALVCGEVFLRPAVDAALGLSAGPRATVQRQLATPIAANGPRQHFMRAGARADERLDVFENQDSSLLATLSRATHLVVRSPGAPPLDAGAWVEAISLD